MNHRRIRELKWRSTPSVKTIPMTLPTWPLKLWLRFIKLECLSMGIKYSNIHKITLEWISQTSSILSKLDSITTRSAQIRICSFEVAWTIFLYFVYWSSAASFNKNFTFHALDLHSISKIQVPKKYFALFSLMLPNTKEPGH